MVGFGARERESGEAGAFVRSAAELRVFGLYGSFFSCTYKRRRRRRGVVDAADLGNDGARAGFATFEEGDKVQGCGAGFLDDFINI